MGLQFTHSDSPSKTPATTSPTPSSPRSPSPLLLGRRDSPDFVTRRLPPSEANRLDPFPFLPGDLDYLQLTGPTDPFDGTLRPPGAQSTTQPGRSEAGPSQESLSQMAQAIAEAITSSHNQVQQSNPSEITRGHPDIFMRSSKLLVPDLKDLN